MTISKFMAAAGIAAASFVGFGGVAGAAPLASSGSASCVNGDGVEFSGSDASVSSTVSCDTPACTEGVLSVVTDDAGVQHQACVASSAEAPVVPAVTSRRASLGPNTTGPTTPTATPASLPKTGAGMGGVVIAAILVGTGSLASLLARRNRS